MNPAEIIIQRFGGQTALAELIGKRQSNIGYWAKTGIIPAKWRPKLISLANENGIKLNADEFDISAELMITNNKPNIEKASHEGKLPIGKIELNVAVLSNGQRVINQDTLFRAFGRPMRGSRAKGDQDDPELPGLIDAKNLRPFISSELKEVIKVINYIDLEGNRNKGYDATILPLICEVYLDANDARTSDKKPILTKKQEPNFHAAKALIKSLYKVGIIALVDEATGYQYDRERQELQKILAAYIAVELLPWQKRFPDEFYKEIFRLRKWDFTISGIKQRPGVIGTWTKNLIYKQLPKGVLQQLYDKTPKTLTGKLAARLHQSLTSDVGNPHLEKQLVSVITLMNISDDWNQFEKLFQKKFGQQVMDFDKEEMVERKN